MKLWQLLRSHLGPYRNLLILVVFLQAVQTGATLTLPTINANLINNGVLTGDTAYIWRQGAIMLFFSFVQIVFASAAVYYGAKAAMGFGRDIRRDLFHQVTAYSAREVGQFGAPSLITRITNDVQQIQMLVVLATTMMIAAPLTLVIGSILAVRESVQLSVILLFAIPAAVIILGSLVSRMVPTFQLMQARVDRVNGVLREQITGIRVVRAFVREPEETERFAGANEELTATALRTGHLMAAMFPTVLLIINVSSIAVLWLGADYVNQGELQIGSLIAYLTYLTQILFAVVMATFLVSMIPRASVASDRVAEVLGTPSSVVPAEHPITEVGEHGTLEFRNVGFSYPGAELAVLSDVSFRVDRRSDHGDHRFDRFGQVDPRQPRVTAVRRHERHRARRRRRRPRTRPGPAVEQGRLRAAEAVPLLRHRGVEPALRAPGRDRRGVVAGARDRPGLRVRAGDARGDRQ